jgi:hypothetical protein
VLASEFSGKAKGLTSNSLIREQQGDLFRRFCTQCPMFLPNTKENRRINNN